MRQLCVFVVLMVCAALFSPVDLAGAQELNPVPDERNSEELAGENFPDEEPLAEREPDGRNIDGGEAANDPAAIPLPETPEEKRPGWAASSGSSELNPGQRQKIEGVPAAITAKGRTFGKEKNVGADVEVLPPGLAKKVSPFGAGLLVGFTTGNGKGESKKKVKPSGSFEIELDYGQVGLVGGASVAERLRVVRYSDCVAKPIGKGDFEISCAAVVDLPTVSNDTAGRKILAVVDDEVLKTEVTGPRVVVAVVIAKDVPKGLSRVGSGGAAGNANFFFQAGGSGDSFYGLGSSAAGPSGDYSATQNATIPSYDAGGFSGAASLSYPIDLPPGEAGLVPSLVLSYDSASIDGMNQASNNQAGPIGLGWSLGIGGSISRAIVPCGAVYQSANTDRCIPDTEVFTLALNGRGSRLVEINAVGGVRNFRMEDDPNWRIELKEGASGNGDEKGVYWVVTTPDGTTNIMGDTANSTQTVPILSPVAGSEYADECHGKNLGALSNMCDQAYTWNLRQSADVHGNTVNYAYGKELNFYNPKGQPASNLEYVRASHLESVTYGGTGSGGDARVLLQWEQRCGGVVPTVAQCDTDEDYFDTPSDQWCPTAGACNDQFATSFFSQLRLGAIVTQLQRSNGDWVSFETHDLGHTFFVPPLYPGDSDPSDRKLSLAYVTKRQAGAYEWYGFTQLDLAKAELAGGLTVSASDDRGSGSATQGWKNGSQARFDSVYLGGSGDGAANFVQIRYRAAATGGQLKVRRDSATGTVLAGHNVQATGGEWVTVDIPLNETTGAWKDIWVTANGSGAPFVEVNWIRFRTATNRYWWIPKYNPTKFTTVKYLPNRINHPAGVSPMMMPRIETMETTFGGKVTFAYNEPGPVKSQCPTSNFHTNTALCFPGWDGEGPQPGWVGWHRYRVTSMTTKHVVGQPDSTTSYAYGPLAWAFTDNPNSDNDTWNTFAGHAWAETTVGSGSQAVKTRTFYHQGKNGDHQPGGGTLSKSVKRDEETGWIPDEYWLRGKPYEIVTKSSNGSRVASTFTNYGFQKTQSNLGGKDDPKYVFVTSKVSNLYNADSGARRISESDYFYNGKGLVTSEIMRGEVTYSGSGLNYWDSNGGDNRTLRTSYAGWNVGKHLYGIVCRSELRAGTNANGTLMSRTDYKYDGGFGLCAVPSKGDMTRQEVWSSSSNRLFTTFTYDGRGRVSETKNPNNTITKTEHGAHGRTTKVTSAFGSSLARVAQTGYDDYARPTTITDVNGRVTLMSYDVWNRLVAVTLPGNTSGNPNQKFVYNHLTRPAWERTEQLITGNKYTKSVDYLDGFGQVAQTQTNSPISGKRWVAPVERDNAGRLLYEATQYETGLNPGAGYVQPVWSTVQNYRQHAYFKGGTNVRTQQKSAGAVKWTTWVTNDRWTTRIVNPEGRYVDETTDGFGNLAMVQERSGGASSGVYAQTSYSYDEANRLKTVTSPATASGAAIQTSITYDLAGRRLTMNDPDSGDWVYGYDSNGNLTTQTHAGHGGANNVVTTTYDKLDRPTYVYVGGKKSQRYIYDPAGNKGALSIAQQFHANGSTLISHQRAQAFDARGRVTLEDSWTRGVGSWTWSKFRFRYSYNEANLPATTRYPSNDNLGEGETVTHTYDNRTGLPKTLQGTTKYVNSQAYNGAGQPTLRTGGSTAQPVNRAITYDAATARISKLSFGTGTSESADIQRWQIMSRDQNGNIAAIKDFRNAGQRQCYTYDQYDRLTKAFTSDNCSTGYNASVGVGVYNESNYSYDASGNMTNWNGKGNYTYDADSPHAVKEIKKNNGTVSATYDYDQFGNIKTRTVGGTTQTMTYDGQNRLFSTSSAGGNTINSYYADGTRSLIRLPNADSTRYSPNGLVEVTRKANGTVKLTKHYYFAGERVAQSGTDGTFHIVNDHLGSPMGTVNASNTAVQEKQLYKPWGDQRFSQDLPSDLDFTNQRFDDETGLHYYKSRFYDSYSGRFTKPDMIVDGAASAIGFNRYAYVANNPVNFTDPTGKCGSYNYDDDGMVCPDEPKDDPPPPQGGNGPRIIGPVKPSPGPFSTTETPAEHPLGEWAPTPDQGSVADEAERSVTTRRQSESRRSTPNEPNPLVTSTVGINLLRLGGYAAGESAQFLGKASGVTAGLSAYHEQLAESESWYGEGSMLAQVDAASEGVIIGIVDLGVTPFKVFKACRACDFGVTAGVSEGARRTVSYTLDQIRDRSPSGVTRVGSWIGL